MNMIQHATLAVLYAITVYVVIRLVLGVLQRREWDV